MDPSGSLRSCPRSLLLVGVKSGLRNISTAQGPLGLRTGRNQPNSHPRIDAHLLLDGNITCIFNLASRAGLMCSGRHSTTEISS